MLFSPVIFENIPFSSFFKLILFQFWANIAFMRYALSPVLLVLTLLTCGKQPEDPTTGSIEGRVYDYALGVIVPMAHVETQPPTSAVISDTVNGDYKIEHVDPGIYKIIVTKFGYDSSMVSISVVAGQTTQADVFLKPDTAQTDTTVVPAQ